MVKYLEGVIELFPKAIAGKAARPALNHIFRVCKDFLPLAEAEVVALHRCISKLLFATKWSRPNIQRSVAILATLVRETDK